MLVAQAKINPGHLRLRRSTAERSYYFILPNLILPFSLDQPKIFLQSKGPFSKVKRLARLKDQNILPPPQKVMKKLASHKSQKRFAHLKSKKIIHPPQRSKKICPLKSKKNLPASKVKKRFSRLKSKIYHPPQR